MLRYTVLKVNRMLHYSDRGKIDFAYVLHALLLRFMFEIETSNEHVCTTSEETRRDDGVGEGEALRLVNIHTFPQN